VRVCIAAESFQRAVLCGHFAGDNCGHFVLNQNFTLDPFGGISAEIWR
jgi:hypothetical protein